MKKLLILIGLAAASASQAQYPTVNWYFGNKSAITFNTNPPTPVAGCMINSGESCASISDNSGNLLFYSDGVKVYNRNNIIMPNGNSLPGNTSSSQGALIVPKPGSAGIYYLFTVPEQGQAGSAAFTVIDMTLNAGMGDVTSGGSSLLASSTEKMAATRHTNGTDVWVLMHEFNTNNFYAYLVTAAGVSTTPVISACGSVNGPSNNDKIGCIKISPCGNKAAATLCYDNILELYDFNASTGVVSNAMQIANLNFTSFYLYGIEFSPNSNLLYASCWGPDILLQYDISSGSLPAIQASVDTIHYTSSGKPWGALQAGPDGRIYLAFGTLDSLACITNPNMPGAACNFVRNYMSSGGLSCQYGLPQFISSYFCGLNVGTHNPDETNSINSMYPNPASTSLTISLNANTNSSTQIIIINTLGANVYSATIPASAAANDITIPLTHFSNGVYFLHVQDKNGVQVRKFMVE